MELLKDAESVMPVTTFPYPVLRSLAVDENGHIGYKWPQYATARSQDLETLYHDCGQFYACRTEAFSGKERQILPVWFPCFYPNWRFRISIPKRTGRLQKSNIRK